MNANIHFAWHQTIISSSLSLVTVRLNAGVKSRWPHRDEGLYSFTTTVLCSFASLVLNSLHQFPIVKGILRNISLWSNADICFKKKHIKKNQLFYWFKKPKVYFPFIFLNPGTSSVLWCCTNITSSALSIKQKFIITNYDVMLLKGRYTFGNYSKQV